MSDQADGIKLENAENVLTASRELVSADEAYRVGDHDSWERLYHAKLSLAEAVEAYDGGYLHND